MTIHPTADVSAKARIGVGTRVWHHAHVREGAEIGERCIIGQGAYIDHHVGIGHRCKIQNGANVYYPAVLEAGVFIGPGALLLNDKHPRAVLPSGDPNGAWTVTGVRVCRGASIGAGAILLPGVTVGRWAMVGAGAVVTRNVPDYTQVVGNPACEVGRVCACGRLDIVCGRCKAYDETTDRVRRSGHVS